MAIATKFQDKSARVILVDSSGPVRQLLNEVAKSNGFTNAQAVSSIADAHSILETEDVDWLIIPLCADQETNGLHTIRMIINFAELKGVKVSLLLEETERWVLSKAFEFGLLSYHMKPITKDSLSKELQELLRIMGENDWDATRTSAEYLRKHLKQFREQEDLLVLEKSLLELYPGNPRLLICLAEALHLNGKSDAAKATLRQVEFIDASVKEKVVAKRKELFGNDAAPSEPATTEGENVLGLDTVVLVDSDDSVRDAVTSVFKELGCPNIQSFADGEAAYEWINANPEPSLIVMEWKIPKLTGPLLLQRVRSKGYANVPVVVLSSLIKPLDMPIIREMGVANFAEKPMERATFLKSVIWTIQQDRMPTETQTVESKIRNLLGAKKVSEAEELIVRYLDDPSISNGKKSIVRAEHAFAKESYELAKDFAIEGIKQSGESLFALNILGKSLMVLRQYESALKCFQKAQGISPMNLERLVMIAETHAEVGEVQQAEESINTAKDIDPDSNTVQEGEAKVALASGDTDAAKAILGKLDSMGNVISYLNNKAVAHSKCGHAGDGIKLYEKTLAAIPTNQRVTLAIVNYNMALAKIRNGDLAGAMPDLEAVIAVTESKVSRKAVDLKARLEPSIQTGMSFSLKEADHSAASSTDPASSSDGVKVADANSLISTMLEVAPGDHCCYLIFKSTAQISGELSKAMLLPPKFKPRKAIERGETFAGAEGMKAAN